jgi:hypothetical protein
MRVPVLHPTNRRNIRKSYTEFGENNFDFNNRSNDALGDLLRGIPPKTGRGKRKNKK